MLECCPKLIKTYNFGQNTVNKRQMKNKNEQYCAVRLFIFKVAETFCWFFIRDCRYFLPWKVSLNQSKQFLRGYFCYDMMYRKRLQLQEWNETLPLIRLDLKVPQPTQIIHLNDYYLVDKHLPNPFNFTHFSKLHFCGSALRFLHLIILNVCLPKLRAFANT